MFSHNQTSILKINNGNFKKYRKMKKKHGRLKNSMLSKEKAEFIRTII